MERIAASQKVLVGYIRTLVMDVDDADDILQETNVVLWRRAGEYDPSMKFTTWACGVAKRQVLAWARDRGRDRHLFLDAALLDDLAERATAQADLGEARAAALRLCLAKLTDHQRQLIRQRYHPQGSVQRMAELSGRSTNALSVALNRIRRKLQECITHTMGSAGG